MAQGNPNKVNAIVDEIVKNNNLFKLKSPIEQDKEKDSIAKSINSSISILNEVGKELVLQELSVDPDEKFKGFIDSVGNVDISGLTQMTTTIVKAKIEEAEREGIDLRQGQPVFRENNKTLIVESVLTIAVIDTMVNNFNYLSYEQKKDLFDNWDRLTSPQKSFVLKSQSDILAQKASHAKDSETRDLLGKASDIANNFSTQIRDEEQLTDEQISQQLELLLRQYPNLQKSYNRLNHDNVSPQIIYHKLLDEITNYIYGLTIDVDITDKDSPNFQSLQETLEQETNNKYEREFFNNPNMLEYFGLTKETAFKLTQEEILVKRSIYLLRTSPEILNYFSITQEDAELLSDEECNKMYEQYTINLIKKDEPQIKENNLDNRISQEIEQLPSKLIKEGFSQEEISEALKTYSEFIGGLNGKEDLQLFFDSESPTNEQIYLGLKSVFENFKESLKPNSYKILQQLAQNDFGGYLQEFLTNPQLLQEKFLPALEAEMQKLDKKQITDTELEQAKNTEKIKEEFLDASGAIESQKQQESTKLDSPNIPTTPEEHIQESVTSYEQEALEEASQNMAIVEQDNSFIGKIKRVFANMKDMKNKDTSKGFFARLGDSIKNVFGKKNEYFESQDNSKEQANESSTSKIEQPLSFDQQLQQGVTQPIINQPSKNSPSKVTHNPEKNDDEIEFE